MRGALDLVIVVVQADDVCAGELCDFSSWASDTTANVEHLHAIAQTHHMCQVMLMTGNGLVEALAVREPAKVE